MDMCRATGWDNTAHSAWISPSQVQEVVLGTNDPALDQNITADTWSKVCCLCIPQVWPVHLWLDPCVQYYGSKGLLSPFLGSPLCVCGCVGVCSILLTRVDGF